MDEKKIRLVFLASGNGGNLANICDLVERGILEGCQLAGTITDRECGAGQFAQSRMPVILCPPGRDKTEWAANLMASLKELDPELIISWLHRLIPAEVVQAYQGKILNLHYSLLPAFGGRGMIGEAPVRAAIERGCTIVGTTVHWVDEGLDTGRIVGQTAIRIKPGEPFEEIMQQVFRSGCANLIKTIVHVTAARLTEGNDLWD
jgi:phosphoribosylglycinamide formyltransferase-1